MNPETLTVFRRQWMVGCIAMAGGSLFSRLLQAQPKMAGTDAWAQAQSVIQNTQSWVDGVTGSLEGLCSAVNQLLKDRDVAAQKVRDMQAELDRLKREKETKLGEYRSGMFCSGCNQTKSEILSKGDTFPHPGQQIVRPTEEQIAQKERELQRPIDQLAPQLKKQENVVQQIQPRLQFGLDQIADGMKLWRTAVTW